jgi:hypothetical protein
VASWWSYRDILGEDSFYRDNRLVYSQLHHLSLPPHSIESVTKGRILRGDIDYYPIEVWTYLDGGASLIISDQRMQSKLSIITNFILFGD